MSIPRKCIHQRWAMEILARESGLTRSIAQVQGISAETCSAGTQSTRPQGWSAFRNPTGSWPDIRAHQAGAPFRASPPVLLQRLTRQASSRISN